MGDVFLQAKRMGWPMSFTAGLEILSVIENRDNPGENGITWNTLFEVIDQWARGMDWERLSEKELETLQGDMIIFCERENAPNIESFHKSISLRESITQARKLLAHAHQDKPVQIYCVNADRAKQDVGIELKGNLIRTLLPEKERATSAVG